MPRRLALAAFLSRAWSYQSPATSDFLASFAIQGGGALMAYLSQLLFARTVDSAGYGDVSLAVSVAAIGGLVLTLGVGGYGLRAIPVAGSSGLSIQDDYLRFAYRVLGATSAMLLVAGGVVAWAMFPSESKLVLACTALAAVTAAVNAGGDLGRAVGRFRSTYGASVVLRPTLAMAFVGCLVLAGVAMDAVLLLSCLVLAALVVVLIQRRVLLGRGPRKPVRRRWQSREWEWLRASPNYLATSAVVLILVQVDLLVSSWFLSSAELGLYSAAVKTVQVLAVVTAAVTTVTAPRMARASGDPRLLTSEAVYATRWSSAGVLLGGVGIVVLAPWLLSLFGGEFVAAAPALRLLVIGQIVNVFLGPGGTLLVYSGRPGIATRGYVGSILVSGIACSFGAAVFGLEGAAAGASVGVGFSGILMWWLARRYTGVNIWAGNMFARR